jgi:hypothetical protein
LASFPDTLRELWDLVRRYAYQELVAPLLGIHKYLAYGLAGAVLTLTGASLVLLGSLRLLQAEVFEARSSGGSSALPYLLVFLACTVVILVLAGRINRQFRSLS